MICGIFHQGSGLGNQLHRYVGTKVKALDHNQEHGMIGTELFKGGSFLNLNMGKSTNTSYVVEYPAGKVVPEGRDGLIIADGEFQSEDDFIYRIDEVRDWLTVEPLDMPDDLCVINFRGGEYVGVPDLFLPREYWNKAIEMMRDKGITEFEVHTDDPITASRFFPDFPIVSDISVNWRSIRYAKHLILSNSSFAILPAILNENVEEIIAPLYWAGYNKGYWQLQQNNYKKFTYIHHETL